MVKRAELERCKLNQRKINLRTAFRAFVTLPEDLQALFLICNRQRRFPLPGTGIC